MVRQRKINRRLDALARRFTPQIRDAFLAAVADIVDRAIINEIVRAIEIGDLEAAFRATGLSPAAMRPITAIIEQAFEVGGVTVVGEFPRTVRNVMGNRAVLRFDVRNSRAEAWLRDHSSSLVTRITDEMMDNIRTTVQRGMIDGRNPRNVALDIVGRINPDTGRRQGGIVGLTRPQETWVSNARRQLFTLDPGYFDRVQRDERFDSIVARAIRDEKPLSAAKIDAIVARYSDNLLQQRGETIARTEMIHALNSSADEAFRQAIDDGVLNQSAVKKRWDSAGDDGRTRPDHLEMDGQTVQMDEPFVAPDGSRLMFPGDTSLGASARQVINCRCRPEYDVDWFEGLEGEGGLPPAETMEIRNARLEEEQNNFVLTQGRMTGTEHLSAYDRDSGEILGRNTGSSNNVQFTPEFERAIADPNRNIIATHNHPGSSSFSRQDVFMLQEFKGMKGLHALGHDGSTYYIERGRVNTRPAIQKLEKDITSALNSVLGRIPNANTLVPDINVNYYHLMWEIANARGYVKYSASLSDQRIQALIRTESVFNQVRKLLS